MFIDLKHLQIKKFYMNIWKLLTEWGKLNIVAFSSMVPKLLSF